MVLGVLAMRAPKAIRNLVHAIFRGVSSGPPRKRWGMDVHGIGTKDVKGNVLRTIDIDLL